MPDVFGMNDPVVEEWGSQDPVLEDNRRLSEAQLPQSGGQVAEADHSSKWTEIQAGALEELSSFIGLGPEVWEALKRTSAVRPLVEAGGGTIRQPGEAVEIIKQGLKEAGYPIGNIDTLSNRIGRDLVGNTLLLGLGYAAGPRLAAAGLDAAGQPLARAAMNPAQRVFSNMGTALTQDKMKLFGENITGTVGQAVAETATGDDPLAGTAGFAAGAALPNPALRFTSLAQTLTKPLAGAINKGLEAAPNMGLGYRPQTSLEKGWANGFGGPVFRDNLDLGAPVPLAEDRVKREVAYAEKVMRDAFRSVRPTYLKHKTAIQPSGMPKSMAERQLAASMEGAEDEIRKIEKGLWNQAIPKDTMVVTDDIKSAVSALRDELLISDYPSTIPDDFVDNILGNSQKKIKPWGALETADKLQNTISSIYNFRKSVQRDPLFRGDRARLGSNLNRLEDLLRDGLAKEVDPTMAKMLEDARTFTRTRKSLFNQGPMGEAKFAEGKGTADFTMPGGRQESLNFMREPPSDILMTTQGGGKQVQLIQELLDGTGINSTIADDFENAIRADYAESAFKPGETNPDPAAVDAWMKKHRPYIEEFKPLLIDLEDSTKQVKDWFTKRKAVEKSIFARYGENPENTMRRLFNDPNIDKGTWQLVKTFEKHPDAMEAFQSKFVEELFRRGKNDLGAIIDLSNQPTMRRSMERLFRNDPDKLKRLDRILAAGDTMLKGGEVDPIRAKLRNFAVFMSGVGGVKLGTMINPGSIQVPGYAARSARGIMTNLLTKVLPEPPGDIVSWAIHSAEGEKWLLSKVPNTIPELRRQSRQMRYMLAIFNNGFAEEKRRIYQDLGITEDE